MESKLTSEEIRALQSLEDGAGQARYRDGDLPQKLFAYNLVARQPGGAAVLTRSGERALFGQACMAALGAVERGEPAEMAAGVRKWLLSSGFVKEAAAAAPAITPRGRLWLASFDADAPALAADPSADDFARRRA